MFVKHLLILLVAMTLEIKTINWPDVTTEAPETTVTISHDNQYMIIHYHVHGYQLRALAVEDQGHVWEDSCVEFFCLMPDGKHYINFETNCIGTMVASRRLNRYDDVKPLSEEELKSIKRICSLPHESIEEKDGIFDWDVELHIPFIILVGQETPSFPLTLKGNFYKCGDKTKYPHFVSWKPILVEKPDFHRPEFFGEIVLE